MADDASSSGTGPLPIVVPDNVRSAFGPLVDLIIGSESMNDDERKYWIEILPVMSPEQIAKLRDILSREKEQLAAIDAKYSGTPAASTEPAKSVEQTGAERRQRSEERTMTEAEARATEARAAEGLLDQINQA